jgi:hypothetical protein
VFIMNSDCFHTAAPNCREKPRMMVTSIATREGERKSTPAAASAVDARARARQLEEGGRPGPSPSRPATHRAPGTPRGVPPSHVLRRTSPYRRVRP